MTERLTCLLDTNALHQLAGFRNWDTFIKAWKAKGCTTAWMPWTITEITATNLYNKGKGCDNGRLQRLLRAAARYDEMAKGGILPDADQYHWLDIHRIAGATVPPYPRPDETSSRRLSLDTFRKLKDASQVRWELLDNGVRVIYHFGDDRWKCDVRFGYQKAAASIIDTVRNKTKCTKGSSVSEIIEEAKPIANHWLDYKIKSLGVPVEVVDRALQQREALASSSWCLGIIHGWYMLRKAIGLDAKLAKENDYRDNAILVYDQTANYLVTDDAAFAELAKPILRTPERVIGFQRLSELVLA